jgi:hypothetical protein
LARDISVTLVIDVVKSCCNKVELGYCLAEMRWLTLFSNANRLPSFKKYSNVREMPAIFLGEVDKLKQAVDQLYILFYST